MSEQVNNEQTKDAKQEKITELTDDELDEVAGGRSLGGRQRKRARRWSRPLLLIGRDWTRLGMKVVGIFFSMGSQIWRRIECYG